MLIGSKLKFQMIWRLRFNVLSLLWLQLCLTTLLFTISSQNDDQRPYHREHCLFDDFKCEDEKCIPHGAKCDGHKDCSDGDDEWGCDLFHCKAPMYFRCGNGVCVESHVRCNTDNDCGDWSDETDCSPSLFDNEDCSHDQFTCEDKLCIPKFWVCDGKNDCLDNSDEVPSLCSNQTCKEHEFQCRNKECILNSWRCDGTRDCKDGSDEDKCPRRVVPVEECTLDNRMFLCEDKVLCVELFEVCNNHEDCLDGSDEGRNCSDIGMCHNKCVNSGSECFRTPEGPICGCEKGYTLKNGFCKDIDECLIFGECDQKCKNSAGSYSCLCDPGYVIQRDERSCKAEGGEAMLVYSTTTEVRAFFLTSQIYTHIVDDQLQVVGVAYDGHHVYWTEIFHEEEAIMRAREDGSKMEVIVSAGLGAPEDLAIDWITKNIYFTDSKLQRIGICTNDGLKSTVIHADILDKPRGIALHPKEGLMYWSDWGENPLIGRSGMDGSEFMKFVNDSLHWPNGIVIDYPNDRLYWVDGKLHTIESIRLDGTDRRKVLEKEIEHPFAIAVFEDSLYWSDWEGNEIEACNKFTGKDRRSILREKKRRIYGIHVFHPVNQNNEGYNPCDDAPCSDICLLAPNSKGYTCACPEDKMLKNIGDNYCIPSGKQQMLIVASSHTFYQLEHKKLGRQVVTEIPIKDVGKVGAITYDPITNSIIMSDTIKREILLLQTESSKLSVVVNSDMGRVEGLAFDHYGNNLYFTDSELGKVEVVSFQTWERKTLLQRLGGDVPTDIAVIPEEGVMFISLFNPQGSRIDKFSMSGNIESRVHVIYNNLHGPYLPVHYNHLLHRIFWADSNNQTIETTDLDGRIRHVFRHLSTKPVSLASIDYDLFWTNENSHRLYWADTVDGSNGNKLIDLDGMEDDDTLKLTVVSGKVTDINHPCRINNGNCSHICLLDGHSKVCACPNGMLLNKDGFQCMEVPHCESNQFQCHLSSVAGVAKHCIPITSQCDHKKDCPNGEDELHCSIYRIQCPRGQISCHDGSKCYDEHKKCDIFFDCPDHSDESYCDSYKKKECDEVAEFQCASGDCIDALQRCDFRKDCADNSDEEECERTTCKKWQFRCNSGACITSSWECDHQVDCPDGSDEHPGCVSEVTCGPYQMACSNGQCIDNFLQCNGLSDCDDGSDEEHCPDLLETDDMPRHCDDHNEFPCHYNPGTCVPRSARCNGTNECQGGEDEQGCKMCKENEFDCDNNKCIPSEWVCDKMDDCGDNSDETSTICSEPQNRHHDVSPVKCDGFLCANKEQCLHFTSVCDGVNDCDDKSDEGGKCGYSCENAGCVDVCHDTPTGPKCDCHSGYMLMGDARTCTDIDECATGQYCSQYCENTLGGFQCSCKHPEYSLRDDRMSCKAKGGEMQYLFVFNNQIRTLTQSHSHLTIKYIDKNIDFKLAGLSVDFYRRYIYWTSEINNALFRINMDKSDTVQNVTLRHPSKISIDWMTGNIYVVEEGTQIQVCNFDIKQCALIYSTDPTRKIDALAVDPVTRTMFWSEHVKINLPFSKIYRSDLTGSNPVVIVNSDLELVSDIFIDSIRNVIYWAEQSKHIIERSTFNGTIRSIMFHIPDAPIDVAVFEDFAYFLVNSNNMLRRHALESHGNVWRCGLSGAVSYRCERIRISPPNFGLPYHLEIMHEALQPRGSNECLKVTCDELCVVTDVGPVCLCQDGSRIEMNGTCPETLIGRAAFGEKDIDIRLGNSNKESSGKSKVWWLYTIVICLAIPSFMVFLYYCKIFSSGLLPNFCDKKMSFQSMHFDNTTYGLSAFNNSHSESQFHHTKLSPGDHRYENPLNTELSKNGIGSNGSNVNNIEINQGKDNVMGWPALAHSVEIVEDNGSESSSIEYSDVHLDDHHRAPLLQ